MVGGKHILGEEDTAHTLLIGEQLVLGRRTTFKEKIYMVGWVDGWMDGVFLQEILPLCGSILQAGTC